MATHDAMTGKGTEGKSNRKAVLFVRGWSEPKSKVRETRWVNGFPQPFIELVCKTLGLQRSDIVDVDPPLELGVLSRARPDELVARLRNAVDRHFENREFEELIIIAFSAGTILARSLYATAYGAVSEPDGKLPPSPPSKWAPRMTKLILLAGVTRGWELSTATPAWLRFIARPAMWLLTLGVKVVHPAGFFIQQIKRGAPFVVESRLKLLQVELASRKADGPRLPHTVLLLGSKDEFVSPADAMDLGPSKYCSYVEVPDSSHMSIFDVAGASTDSAPDPNLTKEEIGRARKRAEYIHRALLDGPEALDDIRMRPDDIDDYADPMDRRMKDLAAVSADGEAPVDKTAGEKARRTSEGDDGVQPERVDRVVFIIHGIRDNGFWTKRVAREIKAEGRKGDLVIRAPSPSYGFFSMWDFINPWGREEATYWFLERYAEAKRLWPGAKVSFVGHSNGTFLAARALAICPMVHLERIAFAGSVVRTDYRWANEPKDEGSRKRGRRGRVIDSVLNIVATRDLVVACLPGAFQRLGLRPLGVGGAGAAGFSYTPSGAEGPKVHNFRYVSGGHGAGVDEPMWQAMARFIVDGELPENVPEQERPSDRKWWHKALMMLAVWITLGVAAGLGWLVLCLVAVLDGPLLALVTALVVILIMLIVRYL